MTTELKRFTEAYATMTVAAYEPLILRWISLIGIRFITNAVAYHLPKAAAIRFDGKMPAALAFSKTLRNSLRVQCLARPALLARRVRLEPQYPLRRQCASIPLREA